MILVLIQEMDESWGKLIVIATIVLNAMSCDNLLQCGKDMIDDHKVLSKTLNTIIFDLIGWADDEYQRANIQRFGYDNNHHDCIDANDKVNYQDHPLVSQAQ